jgi:hypothetical protein
VKTFWLERVFPGQTEMTMVTGTVAEATVFSDGLAVLHWLTDPAGTEVYPAPDGEILMRQVRESSGRSRFTETGRFPQRAAASWSHAGEQEAGGLGLSEQGAQGRVPERRKEADAGQDQG